MSYSSSFTLFSALLALSVTGTAEARTYYPPTYGTVYVTNQTPASLLVTVDGRAASVAPGRSLPFQAREGEVAVRATYRQFGIDRGLPVREVYVRSSRAASVVLTSPSTGYVKVQNQADRAADLLVDGRVYTSLQPYQSRIVPMTVGCHDLAMVAGTWTVDRERVEVAAFAEPMFIAEMPRVNDLVVYNPLPIPLQVLTDRGQSRTVDALGQTVFHDVPIGALHVTARRVTGEQVDDVVATIRPDGITSWRVDAPTRGLVDLLNDEPVSTQLLVDGRYTRSLAPGQDAHFELALGSHHVELVDERGRRIEDTWVTVDPFRTARVLAQDDRVGSRADDEERYHSDAERAYDDEDRWDEQADEAHAHCQHHE